MISVIVCTFNRCDMLRSTLESLASMSVPRDDEWELILVDNNSSDGTRGVVEEFRATSNLPLRYVFEGRQGHSHARNRGVAEARGDILAFTDDDVIVDPEWVVSLEHVFSTDPCVGVGGKILPVWNVDKPEWMKTDGTYAFDAVHPKFDLGEVQGPIQTPPFGANMAFRKEAFDKHGIFRTDLGRKGTNTGTGEDVEFNRRLLAAEERIVYAPQAIVYHPVESYRTEKRYFRAWYFEAGRADARLGGALDSWGHRFRALCSLTWSLGAGLRDWILAGNSHRRFYCWLQIHKTAGQLAEVLFRRSRS